MMETSAAATVELPAPTAWPIVLAFGITLVFAGLVTSAAISVVGAMASVVGAIGWFRDVLPVEAQESVPVLQESTRLVTERSEVARLNVEHPLHRVRLPIEIYPVSAGIKGGLAGGMAMAIVAMMYGALSQNGIWYPINLLAAGFFPGLLIPRTADLAAFHLRLLLIAIPIHLFGSLLVSVLYGAILPMVPRQPVLLGGFVAPIMWSGMLYTSLDIINPLLNARIDWSWFLFSQVGFGIVAGIVVSRQERMRTWQDLPVAIRLGTQAPGIMDERQGRNEKR
jgi:hypothetical protein